MTVNECGRHFKVEFDVEDIGLSPSELEQICTRDFKDFLGEEAKNLSVTVNKTYKGE